jgi:ADP-ribosylglycohydrolase
MLPAYSPYVSPDFQVQIDFVYQWKEPDATTAIQWRRWRDVFRGALVGGAIGDAIGITNEHRIPSIQPVTDIVGGGSFDIPAGYWSDDTAGMLCVATSLIAQHGFDAHDQAKRLLGLWRDGLSHVNRHSI